jgi:hypothetical protein
MLKHRMQGRGVEHGRGSAANRRDAYDQEQSVQAWRPGHPLRWCLAASLAGDGGKQAKFQIYLQDLDRQLRRERTYKNTNELVRKLTSQKKDLNDKITLHAIKVIQEMDPSKRAKGVEEPTPLRDLRMIFAGKHVQDQMKEYRLKKKIMHVFTQGGEHRQTRKNRYYLRMIKALWLWWKRRVPLRRK